MQEGWGCSRSGRRAVGGEWPSGWASGALTGAGGGARAGAAVVGGAGDAHRGGGERSRRGSGVGGDGRGGGGGGVGWGRQPRPVALVLRTAPATGAPLYRRCTAPPGSSRGGC